MLLLRSNLRFRLRLGLPLGRVRVCCILCLSRFSGLLHVVLSILFRSPFRFSDSFTSKVPLSAWLPFGMSLASFGALSSSGFWLFPEAVSFPTRSGSISAFFRLFPWYLSTVADIGLCCVVASIDVLCLLFVSSNQFVVLSSLVGHSSLVPLPPLSLGA